MDLKDLGKKLKDERLRQGLELSAVTAATRINISALRAIEDADETSLPHPVYLKSFVKNYAKFLGMDAASLASSLNEMEPETDLSKWSPVEFIPAPRTFAGLGTSMAVVALVVVIAAGAWLLQYDYSGFIGRPSAESAPPDQNIPAWSAMPEGFTAGGHDALDQFEQEPESAMILSSGSDPAPELLFSHASGPGDDLAPQDAKKAVPQDMDLRRVQLGNVSFSPMDGGFWASFEVSNLTEDILAGRISINFISKNEETFWALGNEEVPQFKIRNYRTISTRLHLPRELDRNELAATQIIVTDIQGEDIIIQSYSMESVS